MFNPATMDALRTHGNGTMTVVKETSPKTNHLLTMASEFGAPVVPAVPTAARRSR